MPRKTYGRLEQHIIEVFNKDKYFTYQEERYETVIAGKPRPQGVGGECKTDVFIRAREIHSGKAKDIKISVKNRNKEFIGNKLKKENLEAYIGPGWEDILTNATLSLKEKFESAVLLYAKRKGPTRANSITVGWKLEIADKERGLSVLIPLTDHKVREYVYKGTNLSDEKKNSAVDGIVIEGSGVAEYLLITTEEEINTADDVIEQMKLIDEADIGKTFFIFTANNYRTDVDKADGPRSLAVRIKWECKGNKLVPTFCYDSPLYYTGERDMAPLVKAALKELGKSNICELRSGVDVDLKIEGEE